MTTAGWILMLTSCGAVLALVLFCYMRVLRTPASTEHMHAPLDIDTHDADT
jgi:hypothetical protein